MCENLWFSSMKVFIFTANLVFQLFQATAGQAGFDWQIRQSCFNPHVCINLSSLLTASHTVGLLARIWEYHREKATAQILLRVFYETSKWLPEEPIMQELLLGSLHSILQRVLLVQIQSQNSGHLFIFILLPYFTWMNESTLSHLCLGKFWWPELLTFYQFYCLSDWETMLYFWLIFLCVLCWFHFLSLSSLCSYFLKCCSQLPSPSVLPVKENWSLSIASTSNSKLVILKCLSLALRKPRPTFHCYQHFHFHVQLHPQILQICTKTHFLISQNTTKKLVTNLVSSINAIPILFLTQFRSINELWFL